MHDSSRDPSLTLVNVDCCTFLHNSPQDGKAKKRAQSPFSYIAKKIKDTTGKHRSQSKERLDKSKLPGGLRSPDITLAAGNSGGPSLNLRIPQSQQSMAGSTELLTGGTDNDMGLPRVAFGFDADQYGGRGSSAESRIDDMDGGKGSLFEMFSEFNYSIRIFPGKFHCLHSVIIDYSNNRLIV
jgi:hypothetical protein